MLVSDIFEAKFYLVFNGYVGGTLYVAALLGLLLFSVRGRNRRRGISENAHRTTLLLIVVVAATGLDFLRGAGIIELPLYQDYMRLYQPESYWYIARGITTILILAIFANAEGFVRRKLSQPHVVAN